MRTSRGREGANARFKKLFLVSSLLSSSDCVGQCGIKACVALGIITFVTFVQFSYSPIMTHKGNFRSTGMYTHKHTHEYKHTRMHKTRRQTYLHRYEHTNTHAHRQKRIHAYYIAVSKYRQVYNFILLNVLKYVF